MNKLEIAKKFCKSWLNDNVHDGEDRSGCKGDKAIFNPDELQELIDDMLTDLTALLSVPQPNMGRKHQTIKEITDSVNPELKKWYEAIDLQPNMGGEDENNKKTLDQGSK